MDSKSAFSNAKSGQLDIVMVDPNYSTETIDGMHLENLETMDVRNIMRMINSLKAWRKSDNKLKADLSN